MAVGVLLGMSVLLPIRTGALTETKLTGGDGAPDDYFGGSVSISGDTVVIGAFGAGNGSAYVFVTNGTTWSLQTKLRANDSARFDGFGLGVSVSGDTVLVGARWRDDVGQGSGAAYIFVRNGTTWSQQARLTANDGAAFDGFGWSVALSGDTAVVGASTKDDGGLNSGSAYIFVRNGTTWSQQAKLTANDWASYDEFGDGVSISGDTALVVALGPDPRFQVPQRNGSAYVFVRNGTTWSQEAKLTANDGAAFDRFKIGVSVSGDTALIGAPGRDDAGLNPGSAYVFVRNGMMWSQQAKLTASDGAPGDAFGVGVSIDADTAVIGATGRDDVGQDSGAAYVFVRNGTTWSQQAKRTASDGAAFDYFGGVVSVSSGTAVVGVPFDDNRTGSASVLDLAFGPPDSVPSPPLDPALVAGVLIAVGVALVAVGTVAVMWWRRRRALPPRPPSSSPPPR